MEVCQKEAILSRFRQSTLSIEKCIEDDPRQLISELNCLDNVIKDLYALAASVSKEAPVKQASTNHKNDYKGNLHKQTHTLSSPISTSIEDGHPTKKQKKGPRAFDINKYESRYISLEIMYFGKDVQGFARQETTGNTIEGSLFAALSHTRLVGEGQEISTMQYSRCGRTDKGVSALGQVIAIRLRSAARAGEPLPEPSAELNYPRMLNATLPPHIRVLGWADVPVTFNARFSALWRHYKYFIVDWGDLDIPSMNKAAQHFVGDHDFRNFCKVDIGITNFRRTISRCNIEPAEELCGTLAAMTATAPYMQPRPRVYVLNVRGTAFLWHQVRCMAAVLLMVGRGQEEPSIVPRLLDLQATPRKPQYTMASEDPLLLYACAFDSLSWYRPDRVMDENITAVSDYVESHLVATAMGSEVRKRMLLDWSEKTSQHVKTPEAGIKAYTSELGASISAPAQSQVPSSGVPDSSNAYMALQFGVEQPQVNGVTAESVDCNHAEASSREEMDQPGNHSGSQRFLGTDSHRGETETAVSQLIARMETTPEMESLEAPCLALVRENAVYRSGHAGGAVGSDSNGKLSEAQLSCSRPDPVGLGSVWRRPTTPHISLLKRPTTAAIEEKLAKAKLKASVGGC